MLQTIEKIPSLGSMTTIETLRLQGIVEQGQLLPYPLSFFDDKTVVDIGAGISDYLSYIAQNSLPKQLTAVDPIYATQEAFQESIAITLDLVEKYALRIRREIENILRVANRNHSSLAVAMKSHFKLKDRKRLLDEAKYKKDPRLQYATSIRELNRETADIVTVNFLFYHIQDPKQFLQEVYRVLKPGGKLVISDFMYRGNVRVLLKHHEDKIYVSGMDPIGGYCSIFVDRDELLNIHL